MNKTQNSKTPKKKLGRGAIILGLKNSFFANILKNGTL